MCLPIISIGHEQIRGIFSTLVENGLGFRYLGKILEWKPLSAIFGQISAFSDVIYQLETTPFYTEISGWRKVPRFVF